MSNSGVQSPKRNAKDLGAITILRRPLDPLGILYDDLILELLQCWIVIDDKFSPNFFFLRNLLVVLPFQGPQESGGDFLNVLPGCRKPDGPDWREIAAGVNHLQKSWFTSIGHDLPRQQHQNHHHHHHHHRIRRRHNSDQNHHDRGSDHDDQSGSSCHISKSVCYPAVLRN